jgi:hypothetical protein
MMSVYYHSLGSQLELQGAPAVFLPPAVRPMPLGAAVEVIRALDPDRQRQALWTILRSAPGPQQARPTKSVKERYPAPVHALSGALGFNLDKFDQTRGLYRWESLTFANALSAFAYGAPNAMATVPRQAAERWSGIDRSFAEAVKHFAPLGGVTPEEYVATITTQGRRKPTPAERGRCRWPWASRAKSGDAGRQSTDQAEQECRDQLRKLEDDVGLSLRDLVVDLADAMAFMSVIEKSSIRLPRQTLRAYPAAAVAIQRTQTLTTTVTVTALVRAESLQQLTTVMDPENWDAFSDVFREVTYVRRIDREFTPIRVEAPWSSSPATGGGDYLVEEHVQVPSGLSPSVIAEFVNVLRVTLERDDAKSTADLRFSLLRSKSSRYMWDEGPGGILIDEGDVRIRPMATNVWRVTMRKTLRFADRTPATANDTPMQFGQSLNFLAPAMLIWWVQSDLYNLRRKT